MVILRARVCGAGGGGGRGGWVGGLIVGVCAVVFGTQNRKQFVDWILGLEFECVCFAFQGCAEIY